MEHKGLQALRGLTEHKALQVQQAQLEITEQQALQGHKELLVQQVQTEMLEQQEHKALQG